MFTRGPEETFDGEGYVYCPDTVMVSSVYEYIKIQQSVPCKYVQFFLYVSFTLIKMVKKSHFWGQRLGLEWN